MQIKRVDHIAIAVHSIEEASRFYTEHLGLTIERVEVVPDQRVRVAFIPIGETRIELVEPLSPESPISQFLEKRGQGLHHICLETSSIDEALTKLNQAGVKMIDKQARAGAHHTQIAFVHPKANAGVLTELAEHPPAAGVQPKVSSSTSTNSNPLHADDQDAFRAFFVDSCKPREQWKIGLEYEVGGVHLEDLSPIEFFGERDIEAILGKFRDKYGAECGEFENGFCFGLKLPFGEISLEPGGQIEFASKPTASIADLTAQLDQFMVDLCEFGNELNVGFYIAGVDPFHAQSTMPWSHKARYKTMRSYLGTRGKLAHRMMQQTMSVQFNIDFSDEQDAVRKYEVSRALQPTLLFISSNSRIYEGKALDTPMRGEIWLNTDPDRCGLPPAIDGFDGYIEYALDIPMFLIERDGQRLPIANGLTFRQFLTQGFEGHSPQIRDWSQHLSTLFPEVRFKRNALELRMFDGNKPPIAMALAVLTWGIFYQSAQVDAVLARPWEASWEDCRALIDLAAAGLSESDRHFLQPLEELVNQKQTTGDAALEALQAADGDLQALFAHLRLCPA